MNARAVDPRRQVVKSLTEATILLDKHHDLTYDIALAFLVAGVDANLILGNGDTILHIVCAHSNISSAQLTERIGRLLDLGAQPGIEDKWHQNALQKLLPSPFLTAENGYMLCSSDNNPADVNSQDVHGNTLSHWIAKAAPQEDLLTYLPECLKLGADPNLTDGLGHTVYDYLVKRKEIKLLFDVLEAAAPKHKDQTKNTRGFFSATLDFAATTFTNQEAIQLAEQLKAHPQLQLSLNLSYNLITDLGAQALAAAIKINTNITSLDLSYNNIEDEGARSLIEAVKDNLNITVGLAGHLVSDQLQQEFAQALKKNKNIASSLQIMRDLLTEITEKKLNSVVSHLEKIKALDPAYFEDAMKQMIQYMEICTPDADFYAIIKQLVPLNDAAMMANFDTSTKEAIAACFEKSSPPHIAAEFIYHHLADDNSKAKRLETLAQKETQAKTQKSRMTLHPERPSIRARYFSLLLQQEYAIKQHTEETFQDIRTSFKERAAQLREVNSNDFTKLQSKYHLGEPASLEPLEIHDDGARISASSPASSHR